jgi:hypothetical protein
LTVLQCDENKPSCHRCIKYGSRCSFLGISTPNTTSSSTSPAPDFFSNIPRGRGRPRKHQGIPVQIDDSLPTALSTASPSLHIADLQLLHHFTTKAYIDLGGNNDIWRLRAVEISFSRPYLLHLILCFSALHLSYLSSCPIRAAELNVLAETHFAIGVQGITAQVVQVSDESGQAVYMASSLVCLCELGRGPRKGNWLLFGEDGMLEWLFLIKGVKAVIEKVGVAKIFDGFEPQQLVDVENELDQPRRQDNSPITPVVRWEKPLEEVRMFISSSDLDQRATFTKAIDHMIPCFEHAYGRPDTHPDGIGGAHGRPVLSWFYHLDASLVECFHHKNPVALILLAFFTVALKSSENHWFIRGWSEHMMKGIRESLGSKYDMWLQWPYAQVFPKDSRKLGSKSSSG